MRPPPPFKTWLIAALLLAGVLAPAAAQAHDHQHDDGYDSDWHHHDDHRWDHGHHGGYGYPPPYRSVTVVVDRSRPGWWRGDPRFGAYYGPRPGYYFAPGYGYYPMPRGYRAAGFVAGVMLPVPMRSYVVVEPAVYGLRLPPPGHRWYYAGNGFVLASVATGMIVQAIAGGW